jgi:selenocysteine-specific elongation factor
MPDKTTQTSQINITLGTAGHIDHGKTALVKLLTGCETDRLREEKERGMSIELGFAPCQLGDLEVGIVDVPGHENFVRTMVAGVTGIDAVIFVVAADDSIMPQTREHLDILTLLGLRHGMVALTKVDVVSPERVESVTLELADFLRGTFLRDAAICPLSSITGQGFDGFYEALKTMIQSIRPRSTEGIFRQPVERTFSVKGFGTVISGISASGSAKIGDELTLMPQGVKSRVKTIQVYGKNADVVKSGQCAALNLPQLDYKIVERGNVLTDGDYFQPAHWFLCTLKMLDGEGLRLKNGAKLKFHTGTSETTGSVYLIESNVATASQETFVQIRTDHPIVAGPRDRYILRGLGPVQTIGGGIVIEALDRKIRRTKEGLLDDIRQHSQAILNNESFIAYTVQHAPDYAAKIKDIAVRVKLQSDKVKDIIAKLITQNQVLALAGDLYIHRNTFEQVCGVIVRNVEQFHKENLESPGIEKEPLLECTGLKKAVFDGVCAILLNDRKLILRKDRIALPGYSEQFDPKQQALLERAEAVFKNNLFAPPTPQDLAAQLHRNVQEINSIIKILTEQQILVRIDQNIFFHAMAIEQAKRRIIEHINSEGQGRLESVKFKYLVDTTRKYALPLLDYMDKIGLTRRVGNTRYLKQTVT